MTRAFTEKDRQVFLRAYGLFGQGELQQADGCLDQLLAIHPKQRDCINLKAAIAASLHHMDVAERLWTQLVEINDRDVEILSNLGCLFQQTGRYAQAERYLKQAVAVDPLHANSYLNLGSLYATQRRHQESIENCRAALTINPQLAHAEFNMGTAWQGQFMFAQAHAAYERALSIDPNHYGARSNLIFTQHYLDTFDPQENKRHASLLGARLAALAPTVAPLAAPDGDLKRPLRIGFVSADLRTHPVGYFLRDLLPHLAQKNLQLVAYASSRTHDALSDSLALSFTNWRPVIDWSDAALAAQIVADRIDILIDLSGHSAGNRLSCLAARLAPIQMSWLGYFSTTGVPNMDYVIADPHSVPLEEAHFFTEKIARLPHSRYCFSPLVQRLAEVSLPSERREGVTFGCFQTLAKINDRVLGCWSKILAAVSSARLRVQTLDLDHAGTRAIFVAQLQRHGIALDRVDLVGAMPYDAYLQSYSQVDVLLDTFPYPGGTTTVEALWLGVPTLTLAQPGMLGRQGAAIMSSAGLERWVVPSEMAYVIHAIALARRHGPLWPQVAALRNAAPRHVQHCPLFDAPRFAADLDAQFRTLWREKVRARTAALTVL